MLEAERMSKAITNIDDSAKTISGETTSTGGGGGTVTANNISGGSAGQVLYQSAPSTTAFTNVADGVLQCVGTTPFFSALSLSGPRVTGVLPLTRGGTGSSTLTGITGTGKIVADTSPTLITPNIGSATGTSLNAGGSVMNSGGFQVGNALHSSTAYSITTAGNALPFFSEVSGTDSYNLLNIRNATGNTSFFIGQGNAGTPAAGSLTSQRGVFWTAGANPIDIVPSNTASLTCKTDGKLKFYQHANGSYLSTDSTGNVSAILAPTFRAYMSGPKIFFANTVTSVPINTIVFQRNTGFNTTTSIFKPTVAGYYQCSAFINKTVSAGEFFLFIIQNGTEFVAQNSVHNQTNATSQQYLTCSGLTYMNGTSDYIEMVFQNSAQITVPGGSNETVFMASLTP